MPQTRRIAEDDSAANSSIGLDPHRGLLVVLTLEKTRAAGILDTYASPTKRRREKFGTTRHYVFDNIPKTSVSDLPKSLMHLGLKASLNSLSYRPAQKPGELVNIYVCFERIHSRLHWIALDEVMEFWALFSNFVWRLHGFDNNLKGLPDALLLNKPETGRPENSLIINKQTLQVVPAVDPQA